MSSTAEHTGTMDGKQLADAVEMLQMDSLAEAKAVAGSDIAGNVSGTLRRFLEEPGLPAYYKVKACLALSGADEEDEVSDKFAACRHFLKKAEAALEEARAIYAREDDMSVLKAMERIIQEEWEELRLREKAFWSDDDNDSD